MTIEAGTRRWNRRRLLLPLGLLLLAWAVFVSARDMMRSPPQDGGSSPTGKAASYVGTSTCRGCHEAEWQVWRGSQHELAMQPADQRSVLGDFGGAVFEALDGTRTSFTRDGERFVVTQTPPGGEPERYTVSYAYGVWPLQQYLLPMPDGRQQVLDLCWDARPEAQGGQRWYHLHPEEPVPPGHPFHWKRRFGTWNLSCAACHSTEVDKRYDPEADRYDTRWAEVTVGCEACHGAGSAHVAWARSEPRPELPGMGLVASGMGARILDWTIDPATGLARTAQAPRNRIEVDQCGRCHSRRSELLPGRPGQDYHDAHRLALLREGLYFADGQVDDEDYVLGSFLQSRMYHKGVTCSDCHEPHSARPRAEGDALCTRCHLGERFATPAHHHHPAGGPGSACVDCHMPQRTYMVVDPRRDHRFGSPRPDLALRFGTPDACTTCHRTPDPRWAAERFVELWGERPRDDRFVTAMAAARARRLAAPPLLEALALADDLTAIQRATAVAELAGFPGARLRRVLGAVATAPDPLLRRAAVEACNALPPAERVPLLVPALSDEIGTVRLAAVRTLAQALAEAGRRPSADGDGLPPDAVPAWKRARQELVDSLSFQADSCEGATTRGMLALQEGDLAGARRAFGRALRLEPLFVPARIDLADLERVEGRDEAGEALLREGLAAAELEPEQRAALHHALGLTLVRKGRKAEALVELRKAQGLDPGQTRFGYVLAIGLQEQEPQQALALLRSLHDRDPLDLAVLQAIHDLARSRRDGAQATWAEERMRAVARAVDGP